MKLYRVIAIFLMITLLSSFACNKQKKIDVVFIGDSIIEYWGYTHPDFFNENNYEKKGVAGEATSQILSRFRNDVINLNPRIVVIEGGINDIAENDGPYNPIKTFGNIKKMAEMADSNNIKVILTSLLPVDSIHWNNSLTDIPTKIIEINKDIKDYAETKGFIYVDYYTILKGKEWSMAPEYTTDGVHLSEEGYSRIEPVINNTIHKIISQKKD